MSALVINLPIVIQAQADCSKALAERFFLAALQIAEKHLKDPQSPRRMEPRHYADAHPEIVAALTQAQATAFQTLALVDGISVTIDAIRELSGGEA